MSKNALLDHIFILRPMLHLPVWTIAILGYYGHHPALSGWLDIPVLMLVGSGLFGAVFLINQIYDIESDRINNKLHFLPRGYVKVNIAWIMTVLLNILSLLLAFCISPQVGIASIMILILGVLYSAPPFALKNRAWPAALANGLGHGTLVYVIGFCVADGSFAAGLIKSIPYFLAVATVYIGTTLPDIEGDKKTGKHTIGVKFGESKTQIIILIGYLLALLAGFLVKDIPFLIASLLVAPFYLWSAYIRSIKTTVLAVKLSIISLSLAVSYYFPPYLIFLILLIFVTRAYYRYRFNMDYPSLK